MRRKVAYDPARDYYATLGIDAEANSDEIRQAYRRCVREVHPDLNPERADWATEQLQRINEAYDVLRTADLRREYDRLRWVYLPSSPSTGAYHSPFTAPTYDPNRPWWEQAARQVAQDGPYGARSGVRRSRRAARPDQQPIWLRVSAWMKAHGLGAFEPTWLALVGLGRSPYAWLLVVLGIFLAVNVALIVYIFIEPEPGTPLLGLANSSTGTAPVLPLASERLHIDCRNPAAQIMQPAGGDEVGNEIVVTGTVQHPDLWAYRVELGFLGVTYSTVDVPAEWQAVRSPPRNQSSPELAVINRPLLDAPVNLAGFPTGYYVIRLEVLLVNGTTLDPCDVVVQRR